jgi:hypothetical protein
MPGAEKVKKSAAPRKPGQGAKKSAKSAPLSASTRR